MSEGNNALRWQVDPQQFLQEFLSDRVDYQPQVAVLGGSGSGKSHLIHWLDLGIPRTPERLVLTVPKTGTSLRGVVRQLIELLPPAEGTRYREQFAASSQATVTTVMRRARLISEIGLAIQADEPLSPAGDQRDIEEDLLERLPDLFRDVELVRHWQADRSFISRLVAHIEEPTQEYERLEQQRLFSVADLPLDALQAVQMAPRTQRLLNDLRNEPADAAYAVELINRNLDQAIMRLLNFSGDDLVELMLDIRRYLYGQGQELVLLIEDFARVQGVDRALLQALIEKPAPGGNPLCTMRWAIAATTGYYSRLPDTVQTRMTHVVDMDVEQAALGPDGLERFAARYLNAARLAPEQLQKWYVEGAQASDLPNACDPCPYRSVCHATFEDADGFGLYPFNPRALRTMAERKDRDIQSKFNPRSLIGAVLADVLDRRAPDLRNGEFPTDGLLRTMGGSQLSPSQEQRLQDADPSNFLRQRATLELWGTPGTPVRLPDALYEAFDLKPPQVDGLGDPAKDGARPPIPPISQRQDPRVEALQAWAAGRTRLDQAPAQYFRDLVYDALDGYIDWDAHNLQQSAFAQPTAGAAFTRRYIVFRNQVMNVPANADVLLTIPVRGDDPDGLRTAAIALEGLHRYRETGSWDFENGLLSLQKVAECLEEWSADLVDKFQQLANRNGEWHPVRAAVELLAVGAAMAGRLAANDSDEDALNALFQRWPEPSELTSAPEWRSLYRELHRQREQLTKVVRSRASATKGGRAGPLVDPAQLLPTLGELRRTWQLRWGGPPEAGSLYDMYQVLAELHPKVRNQLTPAARSELQRRLDWLDQVRARVSKGIGRRQLVDALKAVRATAAAQAVTAPPATQAAFERALSDFEGVLFDDAVRQTELLQAHVDHPERALPQLGRLQGPAVDASLRLLSAAEQYLQGLENNLRGKLDDLQREAGGIDVAADRERIADGLRCLAEGLAELEQVA